MRHYFGFSYGFTINAGFIDTKSAISDEINYIAHACKSKKPVIFDIGGNVGKWSLEVLKILPDVKKIHMFEPSSSICSIAKKNLKKYNVVISQKAVSEKTGKKIFYEYGLSETSSIHRNDDRSEENSNEIDQIDFLKIDTEGHDIFVLKGAKGMIQKQKIRYIQFEYGPPNIFSKVFLKDIFNLFQNTDYKIFRIYPSWIKPVYDYSNNLENFISVNYAAISLNSLNEVQNYIRNSPRD